MSDLVDWYNEENEKSELHPPNLEPFLGGFDESV